MAKEKMSITLDKQVKERLEEEAGKESLPTSTVLNRILKKVFGIKPEKKQNALSEKYKKLLRQDDL